MIDNFEQINSLITNSTTVLSEKYDVKDIYYHLQIIKRSKDTGEGTNSVCLKDYQIDINHPLGKYKDNIISLCEHFKARAYINPSPKSKEATAVQMLNNLADCFRKRDFQHTNRIWNSAAGQVGAIIKRWVIDCDYSENFGDRDINNVVNFIDRECQPLGIVKFIDCIPTKNGKHIITTPFDSSHFKEVYPNIDIHKNNPTVLYIPNSL